MAGATGTATIDFGAWPGSNEASVDVVGTATASQTITYCVTFDGNFE